MAARRRHNASVPPFRAVIANRQFLQEDLQKSRLKAGIFFVRKVFEPFRPLKAHAPALPQSEAASWGRNSARPIRPATQKIPVWFQLSFLARAGRKRPSDGIAEHRPSATATRFLKIDFEIMTLHQICKTLFKSI
ncbi:hypothetical protein [Pannonibacter phragmitetus]|uniref:hypothetical protein n=1 Tax=Pannonibacter phragmitetus TaxID=121719 RepID=UPI000371F158|nr:hypothetical protein [Pannonibacter phragmitetus]